MNFLRTLLLGLALVAPALADPPVIQSDQYAKLTVSRGLQMQDGSTLSSLGFSNIAKNAGAELVTAPTTSWTASAGAFDTTTTSANVASGARSFSFNASATGQTVTSAQLTVPTAYYAAEGVMYFRYKTAATDYTIRPVVNGVAGTAVTLAAATQFTQAGLQFTFPTSGYVQFRLSSASDAAVVYFDDVVVGPKLTPVGITSYGDVIPVATNTYDLGTNSLRWKDLYLADDIVVGGTPVFEACSSASVLTTNSSGVMACTAALGATLGGTGYSSYTVGNLLYADTTTSLAKLAPGSNGQLLTLAGGVPTWANAGSAGTSSDATFTITDDSDPTKVLGFNVAGTTGTTTTLATSQTGNVTVTLPDATGTVTLNTATQTLTGKTIDGDDNTVQDIANASIKAAAGIAVNKLAALTASKAAVTDGSGFLAASSHGVPTNANTASAVVARDASGDFAAGTITADLTGTASAATLAAGATALAANPTDCASDTYATTIAANGDLTCATVTNAGLAGSIAASKLVGSDIATVGTVTTGTWSATAIGETKGGTGQTSYTQGDLLYASAANTLSKLAKGTASQVLKMNAGATAPEWGAAGGAGGINYLGLDSSWAATNVTDRDAEVSVGNWTAFADSAGTAPVDGTGGSPNTTCTRTTTGGELINGLGSFKMTVTTGATRQGEGCASTMYVPLAYRGATSTITFPFITTGTITEDDFKVYVYDQTNSELITPYVSSKLLGANGMVQATFATKTTTAQMRVIIHIARAVNTGDVAVMFDDVSVGPGSVPKGLAGSNWYSCTPNSYNGMGTVTNADVWCLRTGDSLWMRGRVTTGTPTAAEARIGLPAGLTIDATKVTSVQIAGTVRRGAVATFIMIHPLITGGHTYFGVGTGDGSNAPQTYLNGNVPFGSSEIEVFYAGPIPIAGWDANVSMAESSQFRISSYLANGTRVTATPTALGQYRSYLRTAGSQTLTETNGTPTFTPTAADGFRIYNGNAYTSADTNNEPTGYDIFIGKNKSWRFECYASAARTGFIDTGTIQGGSDYGYTKNYDPSTGIFSIRGFRFNGGGVGHVSGFDSVNGNANDPYCDIIVSENAVAVGMQVPDCRSSYSTGAGFGSSNTRIRRIETLVEATGSCVSYSSDSTNGSSWTVVEPGVYAIQYRDTRSSANGVHGISRNSTQLTTGIDSITAAHRLGYAQNTASGLPALAMAVRRLSAGDVIRPHGDYTQDSTSAVNVYFSIEKVSN